MNYKEVIEILGEHYKNSMHFSKYPQDKCTEMKTDIRELINTSKYHEELADKLMKAIEVLKSNQLNSD